jgi:pyruvate,orthophosphate dikinase
MRWIRPFDHAEAPQASLVGSKGAGLAVMTRLGLPVPPGFTLTTPTCAAFFAEGERWPEGLSDEVGAAIAALEVATGKRLGDPSNPLLVSVRSGAVVAMPGMMDSVLDIGLNAEVTEALARRSGDSRFAWDSYRRFVQLFGDVVLGIHYTRFARAQAQALGERSIESLDAAELRELALLFEKVVAEHGQAFPSDPREQLRYAIDAVFRSYNSHRARYYRKTHGIDEASGTAVTIQAMVFGNLGDSSCTGVVTTRHPATGQRGLVGDWLPRAQGDVATGRLDPQPVSEGQRPGQSLQRAHPEAYATLSAMCAALEAHFQDMLSVEFTVEQGKLWLLQSSAAVRTALASVQVVVDLVQEGVIDVKTALLRVEPRQLETVLRPVIAPDAKRKVVAKGLDASPGAASGRVVFEAAECREHHERDEPTILVRLDTSPEDIQGMTLAAGVLTARGGQTSHAAVVARGMGKPAVVGCTDIQVDYARELFYAGDSVVRKGDWITIDGGTGEVMEGKVTMLAPQTDAGAMATLLGWADEHARLKVRANADTGADATRARQLGAVGVGLCRTEHMFFQPDALRAMRRMILADDPRSRQRALNDILPIQRSMFRELFRAMDGLPVTVRLLDPPLHEFLPDRDADVADVAADLGVRPEALRARLQQLHEANPMLGHRGVRIGITSPEVYRTQVRALFEAACELTREGIVVRPEVMVPLVGLVKELERVRALVHEVAEQVISEYGVVPDYAIGTMIELPRAAVIADQLAHHADFFSFGTNDLTQMVFGFSRDDMGKYFTEYQREGILAESPLARFDVEGVGAFVQMATERGRSTNARLPVGVCGEHGADPDGVAFFHAVGVDYVSCSPYRVPVARLAAAHAALSA